MAPLVIRDVPEPLVLTLKERTAPNGRSAKSAHRLIFEEALRSRCNEFRKRARHLRAATAWWLKGKSADLFREKRDPR